MLQVGIASEGEAESVFETTQQQDRFPMPDIKVLADQFPDLEIGELLGQGGMGAVYRATQTRLDRNVALKIIRPESAEDRSFAERFNREARTLARLNHPNIVAVYDFGEVTLTNERGDKQRLYYFLMEYVDGANLRQLLHAGELRAERALSIVPQICDALQFAHDEGIVHRDIKPENILVDRRGRIKIADFGLAKLLSDDTDESKLTGTHQVMGTPRYMAPEQMKSTRKVDHRADIYSLGVVFYEMLTGELPMGRFEPPSQKGGVDEQWDEVIFRTLEQEPGRRYQQASEIKSDVERMSETSEDHSFGVSAPQRQSAHTTPNYGFIVLGCVLLSMGIPLLLYSLLNALNSAFLWIGLGLSLGGPGCWLIGLSDEARIPKGTRPVYGLLALGIVTGLAGVAMLLSPMVLGDFHSRNGFFWIGLGLTLGGGFWAFLSWVVAVERHAD